MDVVHIGYHKTGSTWLQREVFPYMQDIDPACRNALIRATIQHLISSDDDDFMAGTVRHAIEERRGKQGRLLLSSEGLSGSLWEGGRDGLRIARRLASILPEAKVLVFVREQGAMLRSIYAQYVNEGGTVSFSKFLDGGTGFQIDHLHYDRLTSIYSDLFGPHQVLVIPYELMRDEREHTLQKVAAFVGTTIEKAGATVHNRSLSRPSLALLRWWNRNFRESKFNVKPRMPIPYAGFMRQVLQGGADSLAPGWLRRPSRREMAQVERVLLQFQESNRQLQNYVESDLQSLGYRMA